ncbi:MAG: hypothetical protein OXU40_02770 [Nitrospira sp.]|nr:hypothetical protein [Nitrospira sp.]
MQTSFDCPPTLRSFMTLARTVPGLWYLSFHLVFLVSWLPSPLVAANTTTDHIPGFQGIPWGSPLSARPQLVLVDPDDRVDIYEYRKSPPRFAQEPVESIKLYAIDDQFARVMIRYRNEATHNHIKQALVSQFGEIRHHPGAMVRGLNQEYSWRLEETEINLSYRGLGERGLLVIQSRILAPRFLELLSDHTH